MSININIHEHHSCQISFKDFIYRALASKASFTRALASKASFTRALASKASFTRALASKSFIYKSSSFKSFIYRALASKLHLQSFTYKASHTELQCKVYKDRLRTTATSAHTWIQFEVSSQQTLLTEDLGDYIMYHILGLNWAS
ncbi:hypothetical protein ACFX1R_034273 [Malus domestica]